MVEEVIRKSMIHQFTSALQKTAEKFKKDHPPVDISGEEWLEAAREAVEAAGERIGQAKPKRKVGRPPKKKATVVEEVSATLGFGIGPMESD